MTASDRSVEPDLGRLFAAIDEGDVEAMTSFLADGVVARLGNLPPIHGPDAFAELYGQLAGSIASVRHELHEVWAAREDDAVRLARMTVHYTRLDGSVVSLPCCNVFRHLDGLITEYEVYVDLAPVFTQT